jgi:hypothetical protein
MSLVRWLLGIVVAVALLVGLVVLGARFHDGPLGPLPGGPLRAGERVVEPVADWSFAADVAEVELQLDSEDRSRTTWILVRDGKAYVPCSLGYPPGKRWYRDAVEDGRATLRIDGRLYPVTLVKRDDPALAEPLRGEVARKYARTPPGDAPVWIFEVTSRDAAG